AEGALEAMRTLVSFPLRAEEIQCVSCAIGNHEAFVQPVPCRVPWAQIVSDCLYDADKFRWGLDNFTHTVWHMAESQNLTPAELIARFPWGMTGIARIRETFRSATGRQYGPEIIDVGIEIGKEIYQYMVQVYGND
ncbi:metal dependent phosphohydrolase, partial [sediment metagenome]